MGCAPLDTSWSNDEFFSKVFCTRVVTLDLEEQELCFPIVSSG